MNKRLNKVLFPLLSCLLITSCGNGGEKKDKWAYSKEEAAKFETYLADVRQQENENYLTYTVKENTALFNKDLTEDKIVFFSKSALQLNHKDSYYSYEDIKKNEVKYNVLKKYDDGKGFEIEFDGRADTDYGVLIRSDATVSNNFVYTASNNWIFDGESKVQTDFEEEVISKHPGWNEVGTVIDIAGYIVQMYLGITGGVPTAFAGGLFSLVSTLGDGFFGSSSPTTQDVMDKLEVIDGKIDALSNKIDENQRQLMDEIIRTEAKVDEVLINQYKQDITAYNSEYIEPLEDYVASYRDYTETTFKNYVKESHDVTVYYSINSDGEFVLESKLDEQVSTFNKYTVNLTDWTNSLEHLKQTKNIVDEDFSEAFIEDIKVNIDSMETYPTGMLKEKLANDIYLTIINDFQAQRYQDPANHQEALELKNAVRKLSNRISGSSATSVAESYINRLKVMFNFAGEAKESITGMLASLRVQLDNYANLATQACNYAEINSKDMGEAYIAACEKIANLENHELSFDDRFVYYDSHVIYGDFFKATYNVYYTNKGNHAQLHAEFKSGVVTGYDGYGASMDEVNIQNIGMLSEHDNKRIYTRFNLLRGLGMEDADNYVNYLAKWNIIRKQALENYQELWEHGITLDEEYRVLTSFESRDLQKSDYGMHMHCMALGNDDSEYFKRGESTTYGNDAGSRESQYWSGKILFGTYLSGNDCALRSERTIAAYSQYHETHPLWIDDEIFAFIDDFNGNYFFMLYTTPID